MASSYAIVSGMLNTESLTRASYFHEQGCLLCLCMEVPRGGVSVTGVGVNVTPSRMLAGVGSSHGRSYGGRGLGRAAEGTAEGC